MKIISQHNVRNELRTVGKRWYYDFPEYTLHLNEIAPHQATDWHHHEKIWETVFIIKGKFIVYWKENDVVKKQIVEEGDVVEVENTPQSFANETEEIAIFLDIKQVLSGQDKRDLLHTDKIRDE